MLRIGELEMELDVVSAFFHALKWFLFTILTLGLAAFLYPYALTAFCINRTRLVDHTGRVRRLVCDLDVASRLGHALLWFVLACLTFGLAYFVYLYRVAKFVAEHTQVVEDA
ncbi:DUF6693 family protein [Megalodesulfovibrio gigas]|uniref:DUF898 domain-containing protein n=1 Tax=Megalodesulfovibrio gigas (strain ATCC 19364 / DSM 1382 / NCIMB 9332 / VKM B-1759) TaxID=1121448 RepID=T2GD41_MEGG1|nr:DUF6693 family protein [Megalodesulfovibrio gigas]AGW14500.1 hypothetical protein DGI_2770 [Megalodesulfovibrio gigas DSM 1382 = ATCC 19364]